MPKTTLSVTTTLHLTAQVKLKETQAQRWQCLPDTAIVKLMPAQGRRSPFEFIEQPREINCDIALPVKRPLKLESLIGFIVFWQQNFSFLDLWLRWPEIGEARTTGNVRSFIFGHDRFSFSFHRSAPLVFTDDGKIENRVGRNNG